MHKLFHNLHPGVQLIECQDVLLSEETQSRALPKVLPKRQAESYKHETHTCGHGGNTELEDHIKKCKGFLILFVGLMEENNNSSAEH